MPVAQHSVHYLEIVTRDVPGTREFYEKTHGWKFGDPQAALGGSIVAHLPGGSFCGMRAPMSEQEEPLVRTYLLVDDVEAESQKAVDHGAMLALPATKLGAHGTIAIYIVGGIEQGIWQVE